MLVAAYAGVPTLKGCFSCTQKGKASHFFCGEILEFVSCSVATYQYALYKESTLRRALIIAALSKTTFLLCKALNYLSNTQLTVAAISTQGG